MAAFLAAAEKAFFSVRAAELAAGPGRPLTVTGAVARPYVARVKPDATVEALVEHARTEEEVMYPAAVLVGQVVRQRLGPRAPTAA